MKKPRHRTPSHRVNKRQRAAAIKTLAAIVESPDAAEYVKAKAAASLLNDDREATDADSFAADPDAPRRFVILPDNGRQSNVRYGLHSEDQCVVIVPKGWPMEVMPESHYAGVTKPAGVADRSSRNRAEMLALPRPDEDEAA